MVYLQTSKDGEWLCTCGEFHTCFPYRCPDRRKEFKGIKEEDIKLNNGQMMGRLLAQEVYCEHGKLKHLINDKIMIKYVEELGDDK